VSVAPPIALSAGDPSGIGPSVAVRAAFHASDRVACVIYGCVEQLRREAERARLDASRLRPLDDSDLGMSAAHVGVVDVGRIAQEVIALHAPSAAGGMHQLQALRRAATAVREGRARALVTAPTSKAAIVSAGQPFIGQTEFLARLDGRADDDVTMLFLGPTLRVALATTHLAIADVPREVTRARVERTVRHLAEALLRLPPRKQGRARTLTVVGVNPHAGEGGLFGQEELVVVGPVLEQLRREGPFARGELVLQGPTPAESAFRAAQRGDVDGVVAMFHDQATIAAKLLDWGASVNTTWGLSFVRTSVDHGVAYDAAASGGGDADGMIAALEMAVRLTTDDHG
jgi:4-phospho-D-threonate 3-dehydrogenase / 4-phospho-D-erythronate 3-dehydrogenase